MSQAELGFQIVDAAVFSDRVHDDDFRERLRYFLKRWQKQLVDTGPNIDDLVDAYMSGELRV